MTVHRIDLEPSKRGYGGNTMLPDGEIVGSSEHPLYDTARWLPTNNAASDSDTVARTLGWEAE